MNEEEIKVKVADNLPKSEPEVNPQYPGPEPSDNESRPFQPLEGTPLTNELMQFFNIHPSSWSMAQNQETINTIIQWAKTNSDTQDLAGILRTINHAETILGSRLKADRLNRLYRYVRIQRQHAELAEKERALYE